MKEKVPEDQRKWSSLFRRKPARKSSFPPVTSKSFWEKGEFQIFIPDLIVDFSILTMDCTLVGKFMGVRPDIDALRNMIKRKWNIRGQVDITHMMNGFFSFVFNCKEGLNMVLCSEPWLFGNSTLTIKKWEPNMDLSDAFFLTTLIWVRLPGLPLEFWHEDIFKGIASSFGELVAVDNVTASKSKLQCARLYVKVAHLKNLPEKVELISKLGKRMQEIIFEDLPNTFFVYKK